MLHMFGLELEEGDLFYNSIITVYICFSMR